jgi:histidyl-tRNA synthetase
MERIILNLKKQKLEAPPLPKPQVFIAYIGEAAKNEAVKLAADLRRGDIGVIQALGDKSLKAQLRQANNLGSSQTVIIGEEELKSGTVIVRDMASAEQKTVLISELVGELPH